jgi:hypothetical protein
MSYQPDDIAPVMKKAFETRGPVVVGVHVDYRDNHKLFAEGTHRYRGHFPQADRPGRCQEGQMMPIVHKRRSKRTVMWGMSV